MFWLLFFLIALCALAYRRAGITTSAWIMAGVIIFYGILGQSLPTFIVLVVLWVILCVPLMVTALRQEWISQPLLERFRAAADKLPGETTAVLDDVGTACDLPLLSASPDWMALRELAVPALDDADLRELNDVADPACAALLHDPHDAAAQNQLLRLVTLGGARVASTSIDAEDEAEPAAETLGEDSAATVASATCARAGAALGTQAWPLCSPLRAGWLQVITDVETAESPRAWLAQAASDLGAFAIATASLNPTHDACGWATLSTGPSTPAHDRTSLNICLRHGVWASHQATHYGLLVDFSGGSKVQGSTCVILEATTEGLECVPTTDGRLLLRGASLRAPLSALLGGVRGIGHGQRRLVNAVAAAQAVHAPALRLGQSLPIALASAWRGRLHAPGTLPDTRHVAVRTALAATAADLYAADALREFTLGNLKRSASPIGLAQIADTTTATLAERIRGRARSLAHGGALQALADAPTRAVSVRAPSLLGLRTLGRCHPLFRQQWQAIRNPQPAAALQAFDAAYWSFMGHLFSTAVHALLAALGAGALLPTTGMEPSAARCLRRVDRACTACALLVDLLLYARRTPLLQDAALQAAVGEAVSHLQLAKAVIWKVQHSANHPATAALLRTSVSRAVDTVQDDLETLLRALPPLLRGVARGLITPFGRWRLPRGEHDVGILTTWLCDGDAAQHFRSLLPAALPRPAAKLQHAIAACRTGESMTSHLSGTGRTAPDAIDDAQRVGRITAAEARQLHDWARLCEEVQGEAEALHDAPPATATGTANE
ncbi:MAG TPA: acyl-CoA dehydrogenase domain-containing protein [Nevskiaceae bacterium]|nr:acyl-CoA dehydrogenase domain-containing protein [Nevskiaceae bacterium]